MPYLPVTLAGHEYMVDPNGYQVVSTELIRQQADDSDEPGETSLNPNDLWRRSAESWHLGEGQEWFDKKTRNSERSRFDNLRNVDVWNKGRLTLLNASTSITNSPAAVSTSGSFLTTTGTRIYYANKYATLVYSATVGTTGTWTGSALPSADDLHCLTSDGVYVYAVGSLGTYRFVGTTPTKINNLQGSIVYETIVGWVKGRLMVGKDAALYNITDVASLTQPPDLTEGATALGNVKWTCFGAGDAYIYVGAKSGDKSSIYRITIRDDATALGSPTQACQLPDDEFVYAIQGYVGVILLGTSKGIRLAVVGGNGDLNYGPLIELPSPVRTFTVRGKYVYFGYGKKNSWSGLGRLDLGEFVGNLQPAVAMDIVTNTNYEVMCSTEYLGLLFYGVATSSLKYGNTTLATTGYIDSGKVTYDLSDNKIFEKIFISTKPLGVGATINMEVKIDDATVMSRALTAGEGFGVGGKGGTVDIRDNIPLAPTGQYANIILTLNQSSGTSPIITRWTLRAIPTVSERGDEWVLPIRLLESQEDLNGMEVTQNVAAELVFLQGLARAQTPVDYTEFGVTTRVVVDRVQFGPELGFDPNRESFQGLCRVLLRSI